MASDQQRLHRLKTALADRYRLERKLGEMGRGSVYLAADLKHQRQVALKAEVAAVLGAEPFLSEITTTANLQHPHFLPLFDSGAAEGIAFYVMPFALDYAHRHGVIHRDIKPAQERLD